MFKNRLRWIAIITIIIVCIMASKGYSIDPNVSLEKNLTRITSQDKGKGTDVQKLEDQCLEMLRDHNTPESKGKIYVNIASMYASAGYSSPNDIRIAKTTEYCKKALEQPLDTLTTCEMYSHLSGSQIAPYWNGSETEFAKARKESIVTCLKGLKLVLDNNAPKELGKSPVETVYNYDGPNDSVRKEIQKKMNEQAAAHKKRQDDLKLYILRQTLIGRCISLYSHKPYDANELETFTREVLKDHDDAIEEIMTKARERIQQQGNK